MKENNYLLICLMEECSEVIKAASKCLRFGEDDRYISYEKNNLEHLEAEIADLQSILVQLTSIGYNFRPDQIKILASIEKRKKFFDYSIGKGIVDAS